MKKTISLFSLLILSIALTSAYVNKDSMGKLVILARQENKPVPVEDVTVAVQVLQKTYLSQQAPRFLSISIFRIQFIPLQSQ
jgi:regulatory protein YycI of two-component signal transduction system YycFG